MPHLEGGNPISDCEGKDRSVGCCRLFLKKFLSVFAALLQIKPKCSALPGLATNK